jgi:glutaredoxin 3
MSEIIIYTKDVCPYCVKAKQLLKIKGVTNITEIDITSSDELKQQMVAKSGGRKTVPQIFIGGTHVGGCDDLYALNDAGKLDALLAA